MRITIGRNTEAHMSLLGIAEYPFTEEELKQNFRKTIWAAHPDKGGSDEKAKEVLFAFAALKNLAVPKTTDADRDVAMNAIEKDAEDMFSLWKQCDVCGGKGKTSYLKRDLKICDRCWGRGHIHPVCRDCRGTGLFKQRHGAVVSCRSCMGRGKTDLICRICSGAGYIGSGKLEAHHEHCHFCNGAGKIKLNPFNPVIRKGAVLSA